MKKRVSWGWVSLFILLLVSTTSSGVAQRTSSDQVLLLVGSYSSAADGGIGLFRLNTSDGSWVELSRASGVDNPSYLTVDSRKGLVYSVSEGDESGSSLALLSLDTRRERLSLLQTVPTQGASPCFVEVDPKRRFAATANYGGGSLSLFSLNSVGEIGELVQLISSPEGSGVWKNRQKSAHIHCVRLSPDGRSLWSSDLGGDRLSRYSILSDRHGVARLDEKSVYHVAMRPGSGPRHLEFHPSGKWLYVINELGGTVAALAVDGKEVRPIQYIACDTIVSESPKGSADIHISPDGRFLYASNRITSDGIAVFEIDPQSGLLSRKAFVPTEAHPRNFVITPNGRFLLCASRDGNTIQIFERDFASGSLREIGKRISFHRPVCLKIVDK